MFYALPQKRNSSLVQLEIWKKNGKERFLASVIHLTPLNSLWSFQNLQMKRRGVSFFDECICTATNSVIMSDVFHSLQLKHCFDLYEITETHLLTKYKRSVNLITSNKDSFHMKPFLKIKNKLVGAEKFSSRRIQDVTLLDYWVQGKFTQVKQKVQSNWAVYHSHFGGQKGSLKFQVFDQCNSFSSDYGLWSLFGWWNLTSPNLLATQVRQQQVS